MSPDQVQGLPYDERSEIYALGCLMFEALTGRVPFVGESALETINMHATKPPPLLCDVASGVFPESIERIVARCLKKERSERFSSMSELSCELRRLIDEKTVVGIDTPSPGDRFSLSGLPASRLSMSMIAILASIVIVGLSINIYKTNLHEFPDHVPDYGSSAQCLEHVTEKGSERFLNSASFVGELSDDNLKLLEGNTNLVELDLSNQPITDKGLSHVSGLKKLAILNLTGTRVVSLSGLRDLKSLKTLFLDQTPIVDDSLKVLVGLPSLVELQVEETAITVAGLEHLARMPSLELVRMTPGTKALPFEDIAAFAARHPRCKFIRDISVCHKVIFKGSCAGREPQESIQYQPRSDRNSFSSSCVGQ